MKKSLGILLVITLAAAGAALAQPAGPQGPHPGAAILVNYLQLSADQIAAWQQIEKDTQSAVKPLAEQIPGIEKQVKTALDATAPDAAAVGKLVVAADALRDQMKSIRDGAKAKREAVLTPDQKAKLDAFEAAVLFLEAQKPPQGPRP